MKFILFFILFFGLPHSNWIPRKLHMIPEDIPFGVTNLLLLIALLLWFYAKSAPPRINLKNPFPAYRYFFFVTCLGVGTAFLFGFENDPLTILTMAKREITLLLLYFIPLTTIKSRDDFVKYFSICLLVYVVIGFETVRSGVLTGAHFNDQKRGSGPFGTGVLGSDVAGAFLSQGLMFFLAFLLTKKVKKLTIMLIASGALIVGVGILSTYARGAVVAVIVGLFLMLLVKGVKIKTIILPLFIVAICFAFLPQSIMTRFENTMTEQGTLDASSQGRKDLNLAGYQIAKDYPLGVGTGQIKSAMEQEQYYGRYVDCHNGFIYTAAEYGITGLLIFLWMIWSFFNVSRKIYNNQKAPNIFRIYSLGMIGMIGAFIICNLLYANFYKNLVMGSLVIHFGMLATIHAYLKNKNT